MQIEITEAGYDCKVSLDGYYWLGKSSTCVTWWADVVDPFEWFINVYNPTSEELTLFELEFGKEVLDFVFSSNKKLKIQSVENFK